ncbi:GTP-binding protein ryH1, putative [Entamoeba invadens IP1]|uniref:GTP-binding protein ryH1, putative n=1 Tax=Entamoeba invadens IP1 TaxID=370355 RepID=A0A0A1U273_ENTIV|nr:GTP-binding protein ryH1, putative [Entamoeba invadens IP1]ELP88157.1 GTP-binding protein ryH1, putative [Entamoeba invadens IP1]|eukprot:XP_004254928.1 GTP-binding protein ryH1, putative [Entamoeba invadens IP1]
MSGLKKHKIVFLGDSSVGKTCIIGRFMTSSFCTNYEATIGTDFSSKTLTDEATQQTVQLQIWDTAGQERYHSLIPSYIRDSSVAVIVYDINDRQTFDNIDNWVEDVHSKEKGDVILFIVGNKLDLGKREVTQKEAIAKADYHHCQCFETSAKENCNVTELFKAITERLCALQPTKDETVETVNLKTQPTEKTNGGCC